METTFRARAAQEWFGYGRWSAPVWFIGMEPGGSDDPELYTSWQACGATSLIDAKRHEEERNARVPYDRQTRYFAEKPKIQKSTWQPLIQILFGFTGCAEDPHLYQRDRLGRVDGDTALIELSAAAHPNIASPGERENLSERAAIILDQLKAYRPSLAVFYGLSYRSHYEGIAGTFNDSGFCWNGATLCALTPHPSRPTRSYAYWFAYGQHLRQLAADPLPE